MRISAWSSDVCSSDRALGHGETVVQGTVKQERYVVVKPLLAQTGNEPIINKEHGGKAFRMVYGEGGSQRTRIVETTPQERRAFVLQCRYPPPCPPGCTDSGTLSTHDGCGGGQRRR